MERAEADDVRTIDGIESECERLERRIQEALLRSSAATKARAQREAEPALDAWHADFCGWLEQKGPAMLEVAALIDRAVHAERQDMLLHGRPLSSYTEAYDALARVGEGKALHRLNVLLELMRNGVLAIAQRAAMPASSTGSPSPALARYEQHS